MNTSKIDTLAARNALTDLRDVAVTISGLAPKTAAGMNADELVERLGRDGFDEEGLLMALVDDHGFHPMGVNELCLSSMIALWIECVQPATVAAKPVKAKKFAVRKVAKLASFPTASQLFGQREVAVIATKTTARRGARQQDMREVGAFQHKYAMPGQGPRDIIFAMIQAGTFTKAEIRAAVLEAFPAIKAGYLNTMMARTTNANGPAFKQVAVANAETGILTWA